MFLVWLALKALDLHDVFSEIGKRGLAGIGTVSCKIAGKTYLLYLCKNILGEGFFISSFNFSLHLLFIVASSKCSPSVKAS
jgi:hypothetical protein